MTLSLFLFLNIPLIHPIHPSIFLPVFLSLESPLSLFLIEETKNLEVQIAQCIVNQFPRISAQFSFFKFIQLFSFSNLLSKHEKNIKNKFFS